MAEINILLQGLRENDDHETAINNLLAIPEIEDYLFGFSFARSSGVERIENSLEKVAGKTQMFLGIRNGVTSVQSVFSLLAIGVAPYVVDTASSSKIFHPKICVASGNKNAHVILGSANLTYGGLNQNIEASSYIKLDREQQADERYLRKLTDTIENLPSVYPRHVFQVKTARHAVKLLKEGRLEDERFTRLPSVNKTQDSGERDDLGPIPTSGRKIQAVERGVKNFPVRRPANTGILVWKSKPLTERSLNIPQGAHTNITGDMNLGKGLMEDVDFQHYFRDVVFAELAWQIDPESKNSYLERATISAEIVIKSLTCGVFNLEVTHDPQTGTRSYRQGNAMTRIKWGDARPLIARKDLLGRVLSLYKKDSMHFMMVID